MECYERRRPSKQNNMKQTGQYFMTFWSLQCSVCECVHISSFSHGLNAFSLCAEFIFYLILFHMYSLCVFSSFIHFMIPFQYFVCDYLHLALSFSFSHVMVFMPGCSQEEKIQRLRQCVSIDHQPVLQSPDCVNGLCSAAALRRSRSFCALTLTRFQSTINLHLNSYFRQSLLAADSGSFAE